MTKTHVEAAERVLSVLEDEISKVRERFDGEPCCGLIIDELEKVRVPMLDIIYGKSVERAMSRDLWKLRGISMPRVNKEFA